MLSLLFMLFGFLGVACAFYIPHKERFTQDHAFGAGMVGLLWLLACIGLAVASLIINK